MPLLSKSPTFCLILTLSLMMGGTSLTSGKAIAAAPVKKAPVRTAVKSTTTNPDAFIQYFNTGMQAYKAKKYAEAVVSLKQSLALAEKQQPVHYRNIAAIANLLGVAEYELKNYPAATVALKRSNDIYNRPENRPSHRTILMSQYIMLGQIAMYERHYSEANRFYQLAEPLAKELSDTAHLGTIRDVLSDIAQIDEGPDYLARIVHGKVQRWSQPNQPILVYVADGSAFQDWKPDNRSLVLEAFGEWQEAMGTRLRFQFVENPQDADIQVDWMNFPSKSNSEAQARGHAEMRNGLCLTQSVEEYLYQDNIQIAIHNTDGSAFSPDTIYNTLLHEIAHAIGLFDGHSTNPDDVLFPSNSYDGGLRKHLTARDIATAHKLYELQPHVTNPPGINLVRYAQFVELHNRASIAFNAKNYSTALTDFQQALSLYTNDPNTRFLAGLSAWYLNRYDQATPYLMAASTQPGKYQGEALKMAGASLIQSGQQDDKAGAHDLAEGKYRQAYQLLSQGLPRTPMTQENAKGVRDTMSWLNQRLAMRSRNTVQWANGQKPKKKKHWWSFLFEPSTAYTNQVPVRMMVPSRMMGY